MKKMPQLLEGIILRETDRTDTMAHIERLTAGFKLKTTDKIEKVDKDLEPLIKAVIQQDAVPNIESLKTVDALKKAQMELIKARKNIAVQQRQFSGGIRGFESVKEIATLYNTTPEKWLFSLAQQSIKGDGAILTEPQDKQRFTGTFQKQSNQLLAVIMGYSSGDSWANSAISDIEIADSKYLAGKQTSKDAAADLRDIESSIRVFTAMTGEMYDRIKKAQGAVEEQGQKI